MRLLGAWFVLFPSLALVGCASGLADRMDAASELRLLSGADSSITVAAAVDQATLPADQPAKASTVAWQVTVDGSEEPEGEEAAPDNLAADEPADVEAPATEPTGERLQVSDEPVGAAPEDHGSPFTDEPSSTASPPAPRNVAPRSRPPLPVAPPRMVPAPETEMPILPDAEVIVTPGPSSSSPFRPSGDEGEQDRIARQLTEVNVDIRPTEGDLPDDLAAAHFGDEPAIDQTCPSGEPGDVFCSYTPWTICFRPLYFEDIPLERYGKNVGYLQTGLSGVKFFGSIAALPYKMAVRPPRSCQCSNGFSRCGDCPLPGYGQRKLKLDAALIEAAAIAGVVYILP